MFPTFEVVPAIDVQAGEVVQLVGGERGTETRYGDPVETAVRWTDEGATTLHVVDLDGAMDGDRRNAGLIDRIRRSVDAEIQLGGGIRSVEDAIDLLEAGIDRVVIGTAAVERPEMVAEIAERHPAGVMVSLDARAGEVVVSGWTEGTGLDPVDAAGRFESLGAAAILFTNVDVEGRLAGVRTRPIERLTEAVSIPVVASGGVATIGDIETIARAGAAAVVVGSALYEDRFTLAAARAAVE